MVAHPPKILASEERATTTTTTTTTTSFRGYLCARPIVRFAISLGSFPRVAPYTVARFEC